MGEPFTGPTSLAAIAFLKHGEIVPTYALLELELELRCTLVVLFPHSGFVMSVAGQPALGEIRLSAKRYHHPKLTFVLSAAVLSAQLNPALTPH
jgi:hypothetical protein